MPLKEINILGKHGKQFVPDLEMVELTPLFRGRPIIGTNITEEEKNKVISLCPVNAINNSPFCIDMGKCLFCNECHFALPEKINFTNDYKIATNDRSKLIIQAGQDIPIKINPDKIRKEIKSFFKHALKLRQVSAAGDNSTEMELNAAGNVNFDMGRFGIEFVASPRHADGIVITGPISQNMAEPLQICYDAIPEPKLIILAGTDAISSGIFAGSKALNRSFLDKYNIDLYVPGNPPHPLTFINGVLNLMKNKK
ncbi:MAG: NADH:ubiquinone oxidoreductase [Bacteroidales bacterium]|jgi:Ni,Fe-hydrogenase III small subunit